MQINFRASARVFLVLLLAAAILTACAPARVASPESGKIPVVTTISVLNSFVEGVGGNRVTVKNIVPVGASPETYQPTPADIATLHDARLLVQNGAGLEVWLAHTVGSARNVSLRILNCTDGMPLIDNNPHLWMDPVLAIRYVEKIRNALSAVDPGGRAYYHHNAAMYSAKLQATTRAIAAQIATIPPQRRSMVVFHNAWEYYNRRFGLKTVGVVERSPGQDPSPKYIGDLVALARANNVRAVFAEPEYSPKLVQALAQSAGITTVENLYDDSIGADPRVGDYISMLRYDTGVIVAALR